MRSLNQLDKELFFARIPTPPESKSLNGLPDAATYTFRVCVDPKGIPYDIEALEYADEPFMEHWKGFLTEALFNKPKVMKEDACVDIRLSFKLLSKSPENWELLIWDPKEMDTPPAITITEKAIELGREYTNQTLFALHYSADKDAKQIEVFAINHLNGARDHSKDDSAIILLSHPLHKDQPIDFSEDVFVCSPDQNPWRIGIQRTASKSYASDIVAKKRVIPEYPLQYARSAVEGNATVRLLIDSQGNVINSVVEQATSPLFGKAVQEAITQWKFEHKKGEALPKTSVLRQPINFSIKGDKGRTPYVFDKPSKEYLKTFPNFNKSPEFINLVEPVYPYQQLIAKKKGKATVMILVDSFGIPNMVRIVEATDNDFAMATAAAAQHFRFKPAAMDDKPVPFAMRWTFDFDPTNFLTVDRTTLDNIRKGKLDVTPIAELDSRPELISRSNPQIPSILDNQVESGTARIRFYIDESGSVVFPEILECSHPAVGYAAAQAMLTWDFVPGKKDGKPVVTMAVQPFSISR